MPQPRLLLIDDEPALADFLADAARECGFEPIITSHDDEFREHFLATVPRWLRSTSECRGWTASSCSASLPRRLSSAGADLSGFDRRVLESAFRLGEALGLNMAGPVEKPVRLEDLEAVLTKLQATLVI